MRFLIWVACLVWVCSPLAAQSGLAELYGTVRDPGGLLVVGVEVTAASEGTGRKFSTHTNSAGDYFFVALPPGRYSLLAAKEGFRSVERRGLSLSTGARVGFIKTTQSSGTSR